jgi:hypothetical protein
VEQLRKRFSLGDGYLGVGVTYLLPVYSDKKAIVSRVSRHLMSFQEEVSGELIDLWKELGSICCMGTRNYMVQSLLSIRSSRIERVIEMQLVLACNRQTNQMVVSG